MTMPMMARNSIPPVLALTIALLGAGGDARADQFDVVRQREYEDCMTLARRVPADGYESALAWEGQGGGDPARHCAAVALIGMGKFTEAAERLESLAGTLGAREPGLPPRALPPTRPARALGRGTPPPPPAPAPR